MSVCDDREETKGLILLRWGGIDNGQKHTS